MALHLANTFTWSRFVLTPILIFFFFDNALIPNRVFSTLVAISLFILGSLTDYYDGYFARKYNVVSRFGEFLDPLADKCFTLGVFISFAFIPHLSILTPLLYLIVIREVSITLLRVVFLAKNKRMRTERHGKVKTATQITAQSVVLAVLLHNAVLFESKTFEIFLVSRGRSSIDSTLILECYRAFSYPEWLAQMIYWTPNVFIALATYITVKSGIAYLRNNWSLIWNESEN